MDPTRIESYLRSTCSVLDFDIGELWCARKLPEQRPLLKFIQLYTSPTYEDFHSLLVQPDQLLDMSHHDEDKHRFSPVICRSVCEGGQIVWANTRVSQGLTGRIDLPLNTAVGVPVCSIGNDVYILVLFAVGIINMTPAAVEYLSTVARAVAEGANGFLSASFFSRVSPANTEHFVGVFDISELIRKYSNEVEFHLLPMGKLQKYFDCHEILLFCDLFMDFKMSRDGRFTAKQLESLRETYKATRERSDSASSAGSQIWDLGHADAQSAKEIKDVLDSVTASASSNKIADGNHGSGDLIISHNSHHHGVYSVDLNSIEIELDSDKKVEPSLGSKYSGDFFDNECGANGHEVNRSILHIYAHMTYKINQCRFHEFMIAMLGMTVFEAAELWLVSERKADLFLAAAVYRSSVMQKWISLSETLRLQVGADVPGRVVESGRSYWDADYSQQEVLKDGIFDPRVQAAQDLGVHTAFGVPLPGVTGICGTIVFYSSKPDFRAEPLVALLVEKAVQLMVPVSIESQFAKLENGSFTETTSDPQIVHPAMSLSRWVSSIEASSSHQDASLEQPFKVSTTTVNASIQVNTLPPQLCTSDFEQRLQICRSLVNSKQPEPYCGDCSNPLGMYIPNTPISATLVSHDQQYYQLPDYYSANMGGFNSGTMPMQSGSQAQMSIMQTHNVITPTNENVSAAANALANFAKVEWRNYIPGTVDPSLNEYGRPRTESECLTINDATTGAALPLCKVEGCASNVENSSAQYCAAHRSTRRCQKEGCNKCAQGATKFCIAHGGGRRCTFPGCFKGARDKFFCAAHGGGKRCTQEGCSKSAVGGSNLCTAHGGGKRCQYPGCTKSSQSNTMYCVRHGGGRSCMFQGCTKVARGKTDFCAAHGGGVRCRITNCNKLAVGSQQLCRTHSHALHGNSTMSGNGKGVRKVSVGDDDDLDTASMSSQSRPSDDFSEVNTAKRARVL